MRNDFKMIVYKQLTISFKPITSDAMSTVTLYTRDNTPNTRNKIIAKQA
jgi:hypothetical protein